MIIIFSIAMLIGFFQGLNNLSFSQPAYPNLISYLFFYDIRDDNYE